jgi:hypothetical protein
MVPRLRLAVPLILKALPQNGFAHLFAFLATFAFVLYHGRTNFRAELLALRK